MENEQGAPAESPSALADAIASSPEALEQEAQGSEQGTPQKPTQEQNVPFNEHPRFKELIEERNYYRGLLEKQMQNQQQAQQFQQPQSPQPQQPQELGNTPEEREFYRLQRQIAREEALKVSQEQLGQIRPVIDAGRQELARMKVAQFRSEHPDIKPNSPEELAVAERINAGYTTEDAYRAVMWDSKFSDTERQKNQQNQQQNEAKKRANVEQRSIPPSAALPTNSKIPLRDRIKQEADKLQW